MTLRELLPPSERQAEARCTRLHVSKRAFLDAFDSESHGLTVEEGRLQRMAEKETKPVNFALTHSLRTFGLFFFHPSSHPSREKGDFYAFIGAALPGAGRATQKGALDSSVGRGGLVSGGSG